jgi:hypothetical protein
MVYFVSAFDMLPRKKGFIFCQSFSQKEYNLSILVVTDCVKKK